MEREKPKIPNFEILRKIGEGGFGTVFLARKNGAYCALKTVVVDNAKKELAGLEKYAAIVDRKTLRKFASAEFRAGCSTTPCRLPTASTQRSRPKISDGG